MARSDLLLNLVRAGATGNQSLFRQALEALIAEERAKKHTVLADNLARYLNEYKKNLGNTKLNNHLHTYLLEIVPHKSFGELILSEQIRKLVREFAEEHHRADLLRSYGLEPRNKLLVIGPPGNGKTSFAEAMAEALMVPLFTVKYHAVIGSYLGETAVRLRQLFDQVRTRRCLLFFDEFDTVAKERGDIHETGEIKRMVSSLLLEMDALPSYVVTVTATNHPELLDRAVWRRFQIRITLQKPGRKEIELWLEQFRKRVKEKISISDSELSRQLVGLSFAELEEFGSDVMRRHALKQPNASINCIVKESLEQWHLRSKAGVKAKKRLAR